VFAGGAVTVAYGRRVGGIQVEGGSRTAMGPAPLGGGTASTRPERVAVKRMNKITMDRFMRIPPIPEKSSAEYSPLLLGRRRGLDLTLAPAYKPGSQFARSRQSTRNGQAETSRPVKHHVPSRTGARRGS
jgi:hypothetical protein